MPLKASDVAAEAKRQTLQLPSLIIQKEDNRLLSQNDASGEDLPECSANSDDLNISNNTYGRSGPQRRVMLMPASLEGTPPNRHTLLALNTDMAGSPSESVASPPFFPTSRHHSFFMDDLDSNAGAGEQSPMTSTHTALPNVSSPTADFASVMAHSRAQRSAALANKNSQKVGSHKAEGVVVEGTTHPHAAAAAGTSDYPSVIITPASEKELADGAAHPPEPSPGEKDMEVKCVKRHKHRHHLVAEAPPPDPSRAQQWNLLTMGPSSELFLYTFKEIPHWQKYNPYIRSGYRAFYSTSMCLKSMLGWHNETINVYSHFLTFIVFVVFTTLLYTTVLSKAITEPSMKASKLMYAIFCFGSMLCTLNSSIYHLCNCHYHQRVMTLMGRLDFIGITVLIVASFLPPLYVMFHCYTTLRIVYISSIFMLGSAAIIGPWTDVFHEHVGLRVATFLGLGFSGIIPSIHSMCLLPLTSATSSVAVGVVLMVLLYCGGIVFYVTQFPERTFPGYFDFWLSSHQIWHFFVSMAALVHYFNCVSMYQMWQISDGACD